MIKRITLLLLLIPAIAWSQVNHTVSGLITEQGTNMGLPGVNVIEQGTTNGTISDIDGNYSLEVSSPEAVLVFKSMGFATIEEAVNNRSTINITMGEDAEQIEELVVIGYATVSKKDVTGSISSIGSDDILSAPIVSLDAGMQGKMAGVSMQKTSGAPGESMKIRIRGGGSVNFSNDPLYVIDGFIGGDINSVNPNDIERIDILKDASATAIYGSRGANGVVLVTTKTAKTGEFRISFDGTYGVSNIIKTPEMLSPAASAKLYNEQAAMLDIYEETTTTPYFTNDEIAALGTSNTDNYVDLITRTAYTQNYNLSMAGGSENLTYLLSGGYINEEGIVLESYRERFSLRSNVKADIKPWLEMTWNTYGTSENYMGTADKTLGVSTPNRAIMDAYRYPIFYPNKDANGKYINRSDIAGETPYYVNQVMPGYESALSYAELYPNPLLYNESRANGENVNEALTSSLDLNFKLTEHLSFKVSGSGRYYLNRKGNMPTPDGKFVVAEDNMMATHDYEKGKSLLNTDMLTYKNEFGMHNITASAMYEYSMYENRRTAASVDSLASIGNDWYLLGLGNPNNTVSNYYFNEMQSYMGRVNYSYADKYVFTATYRNDATSVFKTENQKKGFWSFAGSWNMNDEDFIKSVNWITDLKLRLGWGQTGNVAVGPYATKSSITLPSGDAAYAAYTTVDGATHVAGVYHNPYLTSEDLIWETTNQSNFGVDLSILDDRISMTADLYDKTTDDVILRRSLPSYTGLDSYTDNYGTIRNRGFEYMIDWKAVQEKDFSVRVGGNISVNRNKVLDLGEGNPDEIFLDESYVNNIGMWGYGTNNVFIVQEGQPLGQIYGIKSNGLWQENEQAEAALYKTYPGMPKYEEVGIKDSSITANDRQVIGNTQPDFTYGINIDITYKDFSLNIGAIGSYGNDIYNYTRHFMDDYMLNPDYENHWTSSNTGATQQAAPMGTQPSGSYAASQYVEDGTFFKVSNATLTYHVPQELLNRWQMNTLSVFANVNNLLTITKYSGMDPESSNSRNDSDAMAGLDAFSYPLARTISFGVKTSF